MQTVKQKVNDAAASAKERVDVMKAKAEGKADKTTAKTKEDKEVAKEQKKVKEAEANMRKHEEKAGNAAEHLHGKQQGQFGQHAPHAGVGAAPVNQGDQYLTGDTVPPSHAAAPGTAPHAGAGAAPVNQGDQNLTGDTVPPSNAAAPGGYSDQYDSTVPVSTNAAAPPQGSLDSHHPGPN